MLFRFHGQRTEALLEVIVLYYQNLANLMKLPNLFGHI